ncbi:hypothetical protein CC86DRAFT_381813 [Ophiobolus disseminans]|uniref:Uncharacterized protein n=1 Tax=Ophiobolus disseminans TaxID=1469910 RepID=A0A6A7A1X3_9PLEO|nr:hypothetical protein CC86DRAFT_381813 [Ophiobolus disseminans]
MDLLDFPPEIFQGIMHDLVAVVGVRASWTLRTTCRTLLARSAKMSLDTLGQEDVALIVKNNLDIMLLNRFKKPLNTKPALLNKLLEIDTFVVKAFRPDTRSKAQDLSRNLCKVFVLSFVICHGDAGIVRIVFRRMKHGGANGIFLSEALTSYPYRHTGGKISALTYAVISERPATLAVIEEFREELKIPLSKKDYNLLLSEAISSRVIESVRAVLRLKVYGGANITLNHLKEASKTHREDIMVEMITSPGMSLNQAYVDASPLILAVRSGDVHMVRTVLKAGADVDMKVNANTGFTRRQHSLRPC